MVAQQHKEIRCPVCSYDLKGLLSIDCPECGNSFAEQLATPSGAANRWIIWALMVGLLAFGTMTVRDAGDLVWMFRSIAVMNQSMAEIIRMENALATSPSELIPLPQPITAWDFLASWRWAHLAVETSLTVIISVLIFCWWARRELFEGWLTNRLTRVVLVALVGVGGGFLFIQSVWELVVKVLFVHPV